MSASAYSQQRGREWRPDRGDWVELRQWERVLRRGKVEAVLPDLSGFWLEADGVEGRVFVDLNDAAIQIWH